MKLPAVQLPRAVPVQKLRPTQPGVPPTKTERDSVKQWVERYVEKVKPVPPLSMEELTEHIRTIREEHGIDESFRDFMAVLLNSAVWRDQLASIPYERRLLLLPKCLRLEEKCPAPFDEFGLLCKTCGLCSIQDFQAEAERLGYAVLVAEGSALVMQLIQTGKVEAIVGVSCLSVLEKAFPYTEAAAIPCIAIPLLQDDCKDVNVDLDWVWDVIHLTSEDRTHRLDLDGWRETVQSWFQRDALLETWGLDESDETQKLALDWMARAGKRWRPFLSVCAYQALQSDPEQAVPDKLKKVALAVECFHKASLIHDDLEDGDEERYGEKALHAEVGDGIAINVGDYLIGEGYRLLAEVEADGDTRAKILAIAAEGHRTLCLGQGVELSWQRQPESLASVRVLEIFRQKTAPAFQVALQIGATLAGASAETLKILEEYSRSLGIAYQIRDDIDDLSDGDGMSDLEALRPALPLSIALEKSRGEDKELVRAAWKRDPKVASEMARLREIVTRQVVEDRAHRLLESYKEEAVRALMKLESPSLKGLLRRVLSKIFTIEIKGWCSELETANAPSREVGASATG